MLFVLKLNLVFLGLVSVSGVVCFLLDRLLLYLYEQPYRLINEISGYLYLLFLKSYTVVYFISIPILGVSVVIMSVLSISYVLSITGELSFVILAILTWLSLNGLLTLTVVFKKKSTNDDHFITATPATEPELYKLSAELSRYFKVAPVKIIKITPGAEVIIKDDIATLDNVFYGCSKVMRVGLSALQFLTANELKAMFARQYAFYMDGEKSTGLYIRRLNSYLKSATDNVLSYGFLFMLNPVALFLLLGQAITLYLTHGFNQILELKADERAATLCGLNRYKNAVIKYNVETHLHENIIPNDSFRRQPGQPMLENIYSYMKPDYSLQTNEIRKIIKRSYEETSKSRVKRLKTPIKLRLKRLPETAPDQTEEDKPALSYLANWRKTEDEMMELINSGSI